MHSYIAVDLETTGIGARHEKITEIALVRVLDGQIDSVFHTLVNPYREIPPRIVELTGITDEMVKDAPGIEEIIGKVVEFCEGLPLLGHQVIFDYGFLVQAAVNRKLDFKKEAIDTLKLCRTFMPPEAKKNLSAACGYYRVKTDNAHRALADALAAHALFEELSRRHEAENGTLFAPKPLVYRAKKERIASKRQKEHLQDLLKYHKINLSVDTEHMSGNEISRVIDKIILKHGRIPKQERKQG